jgi:hypothetical protein
MPRRALIALLAAACTGDPASDPGPSRGVEGAWASEGYGLVVEVGDSLLTMLEVTAASCLPRPDTLRRQADAGPDAEAAYGRPGRDPSLYLLAGATPDEKRAHRPGTASDIVLRRIPARPPSCDRPTPSTPPAVLDVFVRTWDEQYILFDQKPVDWAAAVARARTAVTDSTTPAELFSVLEGLILPFEDAHTSLSAPDLDRRVSGFRRGSDAAIPGGRARAAREGQGWLRGEVLPMLFAPTDRALGAPLRRWCNDQVQFTPAPGGAGYLRVLSFSGYVENGSYQANRRCLDAALDTIFTGANAWPGLVVDVRVNFGGADPLALGIAERLATAEYLAYSKEARADPVDRTKWTPGQPSLVRPSDRPGFRGPVVELTGPLTISAGETFTQALMGRTPAVHRIGEHTQGVFSDVLGRRLPNGWTFGLPNEVFRTADGRIFDGPGIPPDEAVPVFAPADLRAGRDPALARALARLATR